MTDGRNELPLYPCHFKDGLFAPTQMIAQALILAKFSWPRSLKSVYALISSYPASLGSAIQASTAEPNQMIPESPTSAGSLFFFSSGVCFCFSKQNCCHCKPLLKLKSCVYRNNYHYKSGQFNICPFIIFFLFLEKRLNMCRHSDSRLKHPLFFMPTQLEKKFVSQQQKKLELIFSNQKLVAIFLFLLVKIPPIF